jgi:hypothetical protein
MSSPKRARDTPARFEVVFSDTLRLFDKDGNNIEFKCVNAKTGLFSAGFNGRVFVGNCDCCLDLYNQDGGCCEGPLLGLTLDNMLNIYANADKKRDFLGEALPRDKLNAHFSFKGAPARGLSALSAFGSSSSRLRRTTSAAPLVPRAAS